jgi:8-amino-7-oxononanoate synthase
MPMLPAPERTCGEHFPATISSDHFMDKYITNQLPGRKVLLEDGREYVWFSGTDYLGMGHNEIFRTLLQEGIHLYGNHFGSSRNNNLQLSVYEQAESAFASFVRAPAVLTVSSGIWAGQLLMKEIEKIISILKPAISPDLIIYHYAPGAHPAIRGNNYLANEGSWNEWAVRTVQQILESDGSCFHIICTDSVGSPWVESFDLSVFSALTASSACCLIIDDSHGIGVTGTEGNGIYPKTKELKIPAVVVASLNKGMGIPAGVIMADKTIIDSLRTSPWFSGASPYPPAYSYVFKHLLDLNIYQDVFQKLLVNVRYFQSRMEGTEMFGCIQDYPVFCSRESSLFPFLLGEGIMSSCFPYPHPTDSPVTRLAISAAHQKEDLGQLAEVCIKFQSR